MKLLVGTSRGVFTVYRSAGPGRVLDRSPEPVLTRGGVRSLAVSHGRALAGTGAGLYASDDRGVSWTLVGMQDHEVWTLAAAPDGRLYAGTQPAALFRSGDNGSTWTEVESFAGLPEAQRWCVPVDPPLPGRARAIVVDQTDPDRLWVGVEVGGVAATTDGGQTWEVTQPGENPDLHMMEAHPREPQVLFVSTGYGRFDHIAEMVEPNAGVFRSEDHGSTWTYAWSGIVPRYSRPMCIDPRPPYGLTVASAPTAFSNHRDEGGAQAMLFRSEDRGQTWRSLGDHDHSPSAANFHGLTPDPLNLGGVVVGTDTGEVWRVSDDSHWTLLAENLPAVLSIVPL